MDTKIFENIEVNIPDDAIITTETEAMEILSFKNKSKKLGDIHFPNGTDFNSSNSSLCDDGIIAKIDENISDIE